MCTNQQPKQLSTYPAAMCYNCGCGNPDDDMGHPDNITTSTFNHLAEHWGKSLSETKSKVYKMLESGKIDNPHLLELFEKASKSWGQSLDEAKKNAQSMLKDEISG